MKSFFFFKAASVSLFLTVLFVFPVRSFCQAESQKYIDKAIKLDGKKKNDSVYLCLIQAIELMAKEKNQLEGWSKDTIHKDDTGFTEDFFARVYYKKWQTSKAVSDLSSANTHFIAAHNRLPKLYRTDYSIKLAYLFAESKAEGWVVKDWFQRAIFSLDRKFDAEKLPEEERIQKKHKFVMGFVYDYSRKYGHCHDALEILQAYKVNFAYEHVNYNKDKKAYQKILTEQAIEDRYLEFDCKEF